MLTLKHIERDGHEGIFMVEDNVHYYPRNEERLGQVVAFKVPGHATYDCRFQSGRVYVMNDKGRTIASYDLDEENRPQPEQAPPKAA